MTILAIITVIIIATCIVFWYRRRTQRIMENLNRMLDIAIQGDFTEEHFDESMLSSVEKNSPTTWPHLQLQQRMCRQKKIRSKP